MYIIEYIHINDNFPAILLVDINDIALISQERERTIQTSLGRYNSNHKLITKSGLSFYILGTYRIIFNRLNYAISIAKTPTHKLKVDPFNDSYAKPSISIIHNFERVSPDEITLSDEEYIAYQEIFFQKIQQPL